MSATLASHLTNAFLINTHKVQMKDQLSMICVLFMEIGTALW